MNYKQNYIKLLSLQSNKNYYYTLKFNKPLLENDLIFCTKNNLHKVKSFSNNLDVFNLCLIKKNHILINPPNIKSIYNLPYVELTFVKKEKFIKNKINKQHLFIHFVNNELLLIFKKASIIQKWYKKLLKIKEQQKQTIKTIKLFATKYYQQNLLIVCNNIKQKQKINKLINRLYLMKKINDSKKYKQLSEKYCIYNNILEIENIEKNRNILESGILMNKNNINYIIKYNDKCLEIINCKNNKYKLLNINNINYIIAKNSNEIVISHLNNQYIYNILPFYRNLIIELLH
jgi:hypothetical protein